MELYLSGRQWRIITAIFNLSQTHGWSHILVMTHNTSTAWWLCCCTSNGVWPRKCCNLFFCINLIDAWTYFVMALMGPRLTSFWPTDGKVVFIFQSLPLSCQEVLPFSLFFSLPLLIYPVIIVTWIISDREEQKTNSSCTTTTEEKKLYLDFHCALYSFKQAPSICVCGCF